jgi:hypothetical protein
LPIDLIRSPKSALSCPAIASSTIKGSCPFHHRIIISWHCFIDRSRLPGFSVPTGK